MKLRHYALMPIVPIAGFAAYVAFDPGIAYAAPRLAAGKPTHLAQQASYTIDPMHTSVYFEISHMGLSKVHGRINKFNGKIQEDGGDLTKSSVDFTAQVDSVDTNVAPRDADLKSARFFDVAKFPLLTFKSTKVAKSGDGYVLTGNLTIRDKTKEVSIPFKHFGPKNGMGDQPARIGVIADPITLKRSDFGVGSTQALPDGTMGIGDEVVVRISLEATLDK